VETDLTQINLIQKEHITANSSNTSASTKKITSWPINQSINQSTKTPHIHLCRQQIGCGEICKLRCAVFIIKAYQ